LSAKRLSGQAAGQVAVPAVPAAAALAVEVQVVAVE